MSASVIVPGLAAGKGDRDFGANKVPQPGKNEHAYEGPMSVIQDCETGEQDTIQEEDIGSDEENVAEERKDEENVSETNDRPLLNLGKSILSQEEQAELLRRSIAKRQSILAEEEAKRSALVIKVGDEEMKEESKGVPTGDFHDVIEVAVEECSEEDEEVDAFDRELAEMKFENQE